MTGRTSASPPLSSPRARSRPSRRTPWCWRPEAAPGCTSPQARAGVTGDGLALAYQAGAPLMDMEMVQFHPLGIRGSGMILTDAVLGLGGHLVNGGGERFTLKYAPTLGERAPRDIVARAAEEEIVSGRAEF